MLKKFRPEEEFIPREYARSPSPELPPQINVAEENAIVEENDEEDEGLEKVPSVMIQAPIPEASEVDELPSSKRRRK